jgi:DNA-binding transcriptional regulator PaaX
MLQALIPYTEANIKLVFKPNAFFNDLEKITQTKRRTLRNVYYRAKKEGLIALDDNNIPRLTEKGQRRVRRYNARHLGPNARLMVIFDIPEAEAWKRQYLRRLLKELNFRLVQKSVWVSEFDHRELLMAEREQYGLQDCMQIFEAVHLQ